jgi:Predicted alternative tryptophan synthase beta-subunit (paralog of TrpB)
MRIKATLSDSELPRQWYNLAADLPGTPNRHLLLTGSPSETGTALGAVPGTSD